MPESLTAFLALTSGPLNSIDATAGLGWLVGAVFLAGMVRGFSGFGTAMVYLPVAGHFLGPFEALTTLVAMDMIGPLINMPRALRDGHRRDLLRLAMGLVVGMPLGVWVLTQVSPDVFRYGVSISALVLLVLLIGGVRLRGPLRGGLITTTGALGGLLGGATGLVGPPVIMLYMAASHPVSVIRANITVYLYLADIMMIGVMALFGELVPGAVMLGLALAMPYLAGNALGGRLFRPEAARLYRLVAYAIIAVSALSGLPFLG